MSADTRGAVLRVLALSYLVASCSSPLPPRPERPPPDAGVHVEIEPSAPLDAAPRVVRLVLGTPDAGSVALYSGVLGSYHLGRIASGDIPATLTARLVPSRTWTEESSDGSARTVVAPLQVLEAGDAYTLASPAGSLAELHVASPPRYPVLERVWPPRGEGGRHAVYCGDVPPGHQDHTVGLAPGGVPARVRTGAVEGHDGPCVRLEVQGSLDAVALPPVSAGGAQLDPAELVPSAPSEVWDPECVRSEARVLGACVAVEDTRLVVRAEASLWAFRGETLDFLLAHERPGRFVVPGLLPSTSLLLDATRVTAGGAVHRVSFAVGTRAPLPRLVIDEVLANPIGPEPDQEWVELVNAGTVDVDLSGHTLVDLGGVTELPQRRVRPGERVLVVSSAFDARSRWDVPPARGTPLVVVERLGQGGLGNGGEPLELWSVAGQLVSSFPRAPRPQAGISVARRHPLLLDDDDAAFGLHAEPGASPGAVNVLR